MTANFLNAVICLYGNRYEEAIGYTDMVLGRRTCLEAMSLKGVLFMNSSDMTRHTM